MQNQPSLSAAPSNPAARRRGGSREQRYEQLTKQTHTALLTQPIADLGEGGTSFLLAKGQHDFAETRVGFHALMRVPDFICRISTVDDRTNRAA
jgi:hypothetical protein